MTITMSHDRPGYKEIGGVCAQVDECDLGTHKCEYYCNDTAGSYECSCPFDKKLDPNGHNCSFIVSSLNTILKYYASTCKCRL